MIAPRERKTICGFLFGSVVIDECVVTSKSVLVVVMRKRLENSDFVFCFFSSKCLCSLCLFLNNNGDKTLGVLDVDSLDVAVELLLGALLVVSPSADADAESVRDTLDTLLPDLLVQLGVDADIRRLHSLLGEGLDLLDSLGSPLLEGDAVQSLVHVDGVLAGDDLVDGGLAALLLSFRRHFYIRVTW